ncbi:hypothetical protein C2E23DRAFT_743313 [Lenzites betulinus]|nr:hypothetical protein C2E23DRAFT_743313 [Lenzites betulinus]
MFSALPASPSRFLAALILALLQLPRAQSATTLQNVTVDDTDGSTTGGFEIVYAPPGVWSLGQSCTTCEAGVDKSKALDGTWHDVSYISDNPPPAPITATLQFEGVAVYAYCIITRAFSDPNGNYDMSFQIDGKDAGTFELAPNGSTTYQYNVPVFSSGPLSSGTHTLTMTVGHAGGNSSLALLDYFVFTYVYLLVLPRERMTDGTAAKK